MRHSLLALIITLIPMAVAGWLGWAMLADWGISLMIALLAGVTFAPPIARLAAGSATPAARARP